MKRSLRRRTTALPAALVILGAASPCGLFHRPAWGQIPGPPPDAQRVVFASRPSTVGDQVGQAISSRVQLTTSRREGNQLVEKSTATMYRSQRRLITTTAVADGRAQAVLVRYLEATEQKSASEAPATPTTGGQQPPVGKVTLPVEGKAYHCRREGQRLIVTDEEGRLPTLAEFEIVAADMDAVGRPNPFTEFLAGRSVAVGERLSLPKDVAERLLNVGGSFDELKRFDLTLREVKSEGGKPLAIFQASVAAQSHGSSPLHLQVEGPLVVQIDTCRAVRTSLSGPLGMTETQVGPVAYQEFVAGKLSITLASTYRDAVR